MSHLITSLRYISNLDYDHPRSCIFNVYLVLNHVNQLTCSCLQFIFGHDFSDNEGLDFMSACTAYICNIYVGYNGPKFIHDFKVSIIVNHLTPIRQAFV